MKDTLNPIATFDEIGKAYAEAGWGDPINYFHKLSERLFPDNMDDRKFARMSMYGSYTLKAAEIALGLKEKGDSDG